MNIFRCKYCKEEIPIDQYWRSKLRKHFESKHIELKSKGFISAHHIKTTHFIRVIKKD